MLLHLFTTGYTSRLSGNVCFCAASGGRPDFVRREIDAVHSAPGAPPDDVCKLMKH